MSEQSKQMLKSTHKGVHEQFDMLYTSMMTQFIFLTDMYEDKLEGATEKEIKKLVIEVQTRKMKEIGYSPGWLQKRVLFAVYCHYEDFYLRYVDYFPPLPSEKLDVVQFKILEIAALYLDKTFSEKGMVDVCDFLELDMMFIKIMYYS